MTRDGASRRHLISIDVVVLAIRPQGHRRDHRNSALAPDCFQPPRFHRRNFSYKSQVVAFSLLLACTKRSAIATAQTYSGISCRTLQQVVDAGDEHQAASVVIQAKTEIAIIGVQGKLNLRQLWRGKHPHPALAAVKIAEAGFHLTWSHLVIQMNVDGRKNSPRNRQKVRGKNQFAGLEIQLLENLAYMTMFKNRICGQIVGDRNKVGARTGFLACTRDAGLRVRNNAAFAIHDSSPQQRRESENY